MDAKLPSFDETSKKPARRLLVWSAIISIYAFFFVAAMAFSGWTLYAAFQKTQEKTKALYATATARAQWPVVFSDDFRKASDHWYTGTYKNMGYTDSRTIANGVYTWYLESALGYTFWQPAAAGSLGNFNLSVDVRHKYGTPYDGYGVIFRNTGDNYYFFAIHDNRTYDIALQNNGNWSFLIPLTQSNLIKPGAFNRLRVEAQADLFKLFINEKFVREFRDGTLPNGDVGLMLSQQNKPVESDGSETQGVKWVPASSFVTVEYDNFEVRAPTGSVAESRPPQLPQIQPARGKLVFASDRDGNRNIYTINADGSDLKQLTDNPEADYSPRWSPDGKKIVFVSLRAGNSEIYVMDANGANVTRLTNHPAVDMTPSWSPDGTQIIFASQRSGNYDLYIMPVSGEATSLTQITTLDLNEINPNISPDGKQVLFQSMEKTIHHYELAIISMDGKQRKRIAFYDGMTYSSGRWSPDGKRIVYDVKGYDERGAIAIENAQAITAKYIDYALIDNDGSNLWPAWSPEGTQIAFVSDMEGQTDIYIIPTDGSGLFRVTHNEAKEESPDWTSP